jgi:hypothetical protein
VLPPAQLRTIHVSAPDIAARDAVPA